MNLKVCGPNDLLRHGIDRQGKSVAVAWSEITKEIYSYTEDPDTLVEIFGRADSLEEARQQIASCPRDDQARTILETLGRALNGDRYRL